METCEGAPQGEVCPGRKCATASVPQGGQLGTRGCGGLMRWESGVFGWAVEACGWERVCACVPRAPLL